MSTTRQFRLPVDAAGLARLHGEQCCADGCDAVTGLRDAGTVDTVSSDGMHLGWRVKACAEHKEGSS